MKKSILSTVILLLLASGLFAQKGIKIGFLVSPNLAFSSVTDSSKKKDPNITTAVRPGVGFGLAITYGFTEAIGIRTGAQVVVKNMTIKDNILGSTTQYRIIAVNVPFGLKLRSPEIGDGIHVTGFLGGAAEINVSSMRKTTLFGITDTDTKLKNVNPITVDPVFGLGIDWQFDWGMIHMGPSFHWGLMRVLNRKQNGYLNVKQSYVALDLGYFF